MNISPTIYENLTNQQRVIASISARARGDDAELKRLVTSCPKKTYRMTDPAYSERMETLVDMVTVVELDLRSCALKFFLADRLAEEQQEPTKISALREAASINAAFQNVLKSEGIDFNEMAKIRDEVTHNAVRFLENFEQEPDPEETAHYQALLEEALKQTEK